MGDKFGTIKNPLTIIAIFAGIAEVSGTGVLPFVNPTNQLTFIYFLITFPSILIVLFFATLNFNNKALYAPSDFNNEENYIKIFKYDISKQENIQIEVPQDKLLKSLNENFVRLQISNDERFLSIENNIKTFKTKGPLLQIDSDELSFDDINRGHTIEISNFRNAEILRKTLSNKGYDAEVYTDYEENILNSYSDHKAIWLGKRVDLLKAIEVISISKRMFKHLEYIDLSDRDTGAAPDFVHDSIFIGGATDSAISRGLKKLSIEDFQKISTMKTSHELHLFIKKFRS